MPAFKYQQGDRPLEGYTIEYGLGRGGFGEVYFAVSDSGRQVALKAVQNYEEVELRGIRHCMNLKSPHLVTIFDLKFNDRGEPFVIMEYVSGPSLRGLLDEAPQGLGETKSAFFLQEMAKGLTYLHDQGIVHRDLKPHNVFYEDGFVKIGDYSLSKALTASHRSGHTVTVGTVHYMAPEISMGRYDERVDIYAMGIILYEMLTGQPPFTGQTMGEVLMKHITGEVDLQGVEEPFAGTIRKALAKNPDERFGSAAEMAASVFGARHVQDSVAEFNPQHLSLVAARVGAKVQAATAATLAHAATPTPAQASTRKDPPIRDIDPDIPSVPYLAGRSFGLLAKHTGLMPRRTAAADASFDPIDHQQRITLTLFCILAIAVGCGLLASGGFSTSAIQVGIWTLGTIGGGAMGILVASRWFGPTLAAESGLVSRIILTTACWLGGWIGLLILSPFSAILGKSGSALPGGHGVSPLIWATFLPLLMLDLRQFLAAGRRQRVVLGPALLTGFVGCLISLFLGANPVFPLAVAAGVVLAIQVASPFAGRSARRRGSPFAGEPFTDLAPHSAEPAVLVSDAVPAAASPQPSESAAGADASPERISSRNRTIALILAIGPAFAGICGLQRLYVGKVWTGLLYLITAGLFGIGQVIDIVLIAVGQFEDDQDRPLTLWEGGSVVGSSSSQPVNSWSSIPATRQWGTLLANVLGILLLLAACLVGLFSAMRIPEAIAAWEQMELLDTTFAHDLEQWLGTGNWQRLVTRLGTIGSLSLFLSGIAVLLLARRSAGAWHMMRAILGSACCLATIGMFASSFRLIDWPRLANLVAAGQIGTAMDAVITNQFLVIYLCAGVLLLTGLLVLCWPPKRASVSASAAQKMEEVMR